MIGRRALVLTALALAALLAALTALVALGDRTGPADAEVGAWITGLREPWLTELMRLLTHLGSMAVLAPVLLVVAAWAVRRRRSLRPLAFLAVALGGAALLNEALKRAVERPRPAVDALISAQGYGFPSGHSAQAAAGWLGAAVVVLAVARPPMRRAPVLAAAAAVVLVVGFSRVYLGVHAPADVLGGWAMGSLWLTLVVLVARAPGVRRPVAGEPEP